jgi:hypothetical protein
MTDEIAVHDTDPVALFELGQRRAKLYAESGYWPDAKSIAQAFVKLEAGRELGLNPITAMNEVHVIQGKPDLGAGALSMLVKDSSRYDYEVVELTNEKCVIRFDDLVRNRSNKSEFTIKDAETAELTSNKTYKRYPRNMLFARAMSNGVGWFCPDVTRGKFYIEGEIAESLAVDETDENDVYVSPIDQTEEYEARVDLAESADDPPPMSPGGLRLPVGTPAENATAGGQNP